MSSHQKTTKSAQRIRRHARVRGTIAGTASRPRIAVFRSNTALYAQLIDDAAGHTLAAVDTRTQKGATLKERATAAGETLATLAKKAGVEKVVFDRGGMRYTGNVALFADAARKTGLVF